MSNKIKITVYKGLIAGFVMGLILIILSFLNKLDILTGVYLFIVSIPLVICGYILSSGLLTNDSISSALFAVLVLGYLGIMGQIIFLLRLNPRVFKYWALLMLILFINIITYKYAAVFIKFFHS